MPNSCPIASTQAKTVQAFLAFAPVFQRYTHDATGTGTRYRPRMNLFLNTKEASRPEPSETLLTATRAIH